MPVTTNVDEHVFRCKILIFCTFFFISVTVFRMHLFLDGPGFFNRQSPGTIWSPTSIMWCIVRQIRWNKRFGDLPVSATDSAWKKRPLTSTPNVRLHFSNRSIICERPSALSLQMPSWWQHHHIHWCLEVYVYSNNCKPFVYANLCSIVLYCTEGNRFIVFWWHMTSNFHVQRLSCPVYDSWVILLLMILSASLGNNRCRMNMF